MSLNVQVTEFSFIGIEAECGMYRFHVMIDSFKRIDRSLIKI